MRDWVEIAVVKCSNDLSVNLEHLKKLDNQNHRNLSEKYLSVQLTSENLGEEIGDEEPGWKWQLPNVRMICQSTYYT